MRFSYISFRTWAKFETMGYPKRSLGAKFHPQPKKEEYPGASPKERLWLSVCRELKACDIVQSRCLDSRCSLTPDSKDFRCSYSVSRDIYIVPFMKSISFLNCFAVIGPLSLAVRRMVSTSRCISPGPRRPGTTCLRNAICHLYRYCQCPDLELFQPLDSLSLRREIALPRAS